MPHESLVLRGIIMPSSFIPYPAPLQFKINNFHTGVVSRLGTARECKNPNHFAPLENSEISANYLTFYTLLWLQRTLRHLAFNYDNDWIMMFRYFISLCHQHPSPSHKPHRVLCTFTPSLYISKRLR